MTPEEKKLITSRMTLTEGMTLRSSQSVSLAATHIVVYVVDDVATIRNLATNETDKLRVDQDHFWIPAAIGRSS